MNMDLEKTSTSIPLHERKEVWLKAWCALVSTDGLIEPEDVNVWADNCLESYEKRFSQNN